MKLSGKMKLIFGGLIAVMLILLGVIAARVSYNTVLNTVRDNMTTSTTLAGNQIAAMMSDYMNIATVSGTDGILTDASATDQAKSDRVDELAASYGFTSGNVLGLDGVSLKDGTDFSEREYVQQALNGVTNVSDITLSKYTGKYGFSVAAPLMRNGSICGVVYYRMDIDFMSAITESIDISDNSYAYIVDGTGMVIVHPNEEYITTMNITEQSGQLGSIGSKVVAGEEGNSEYTFDGEDYLCGYAPIDNTNGWSIVIAAPKSDFTSVTTNLLSHIGIIALVLVVVSVVISGLYASTMSKNIGRASKAIEELSEGKLDSTLDESTSRDEIGILINSTVSLQNTLKGIIGEANGILGAMAEYNLTSRDMKNYPGDFNSLAISVNNINSILRELIQEVSESANCVGVGAKELADASENMSSGTVLQANSIQTVASDVDNMADSVASISHSGENVNAQLQSLDEQIKNGNEEMEQLADAVRQAEEMSGDIKKIVGTIDSIAFQTNILALNAAVEAASAGEYGKGFAVVADEIGNLAGKCSQSSKQTEELINSCLAKILKAKQCADTTAECLNAVVASSAEISEAFGQISRDTAEQADRSVNVKREVNNISDVIQNNTATAQETAAASAELSAQAVNLNDMIRKFRI